MKRLLPLILALVLAVDLMEDGCFGKGPFYLPGPFSEVAITSSLIIMARSGLIFAMNFDL